MYPNATLYQERLQSFYSANAALPPHCILLPETTEDVSRIMDVISKNFCSFGIRSGGHSAFRGSNSVDDGVTIDFGWFTWAGFLRTLEHVDANIEPGYMNQTHFDVGTNIASVQPGARWGAVYEALDPYGVTAAGGRADVVGVGGFITGGGYSFHAGTMGWACDAVHNFELVLANGSVVTANGNEHVDLFQAMKGSSGNLGLVTRVDLCKLNRSLDAFSG